MFQTPILPELAIYANDYESLEKTFRGIYFGLVHAEHFTDEDVEVSPLE
jgi:hypothetical protein